MAGPHRRAHYIGQLREDATCLFLASSPEDPGLEMPAAACSPIRGAVRHAARLWRYAVPRSRSSELAKHASVTAVSSGMINLSEAHAAISLQNLGSPSSCHRNIACGFDHWASLFGVGEQFASPGRPLWQLIELARANRSRP
jgi:hypothetical protein